mmetsp:Transcript_18710/g.33838  ORF Transcript_18710/g.33838 Transcript_18710/m.33838 type:complete len:482 (-) Transcript_18710:132-1577(-)
MAPVYSVLDGQFHRDLDPYLSGFADVLPHEGGGCEPMSLSARNQHAGHALLHGYSVDALKNRKSSRPLLALKRSFRARTLGIMKSRLEEYVEGASSARDWYHFRKAAWKLEEQRAKNDRNGIRHAKGIRSRLLRAGKGKNGRDILSDVRMELDEVRQSEAPVEVCQGVKDLPSHERYWRWFQALHSADIVASMYEPPKRTGDVFERIQAALGKLRCPEDRFDEIRATFLRRFGARILRNLDGAGWQTQSLSTLDPAPVSTIVKERFLSTFSNFSSAQLRATFHGTNIGNFPSIFSQGLLVPNPDENGLQVVHGSAHGLGVYSAKLSSPQLACSFARGAQKVIVCAVIDDSTPLAEPKTYGCMLCRRESSQVRHVGDAVVVLDHTHVAPLFIAQSQSRQKQEQQRRPTGTGRRTITPAHFLHFRRSRRREKPQNWWVVVPYLASRADKLGARWQWCTHLKNRRQKWLKAHGLWDEGVARQLF